MLEGGGVLIRPVQCTEAMQSAMVNMQNTRVTAISQKHESQFKSFLLPLSFFSFNIF